MISFTGYDVTLLIKAVKQQAMMTLYLLLISFLLWFLIVTRQYYYPVYKNYFINFANLMFSKFIIHQLCSNCLLFRVVSKLRSKISKLGWKQLTFFDYTHIHIYSAKQCDREYTYIYQKSEEQYDKKCRSQNERK